MDAKAEARAELEAERVAGIWTESVDEARAAKAKAAKAEKRAAKRAAEEE